MKRLLYSMILICLANYAPLKPAEAPDRAKLRRQLKLARRLIKEAKAGNLKRVKQLIRHDANVNHAEDEGKTALIWAAYYGHIAIVNALLASPSINVNHADDDKKTALSWATERGHTDVVKALLAIPDINVNYTAFWGWTALMSAAQEGHTDIVEALIAAGANPLLRNNIGRTALDYAHNDEIRNILQDTMDQWIKAKQAEPILKQHLETLEGEPQIAPLIRKFLTGEK